MKFVRIRPYDKRRGQLVRRYVYRGFRFEVERGWYEVEDHIAEALEGVLTFPDNPDSKPVFDVSTREDAEALARAEYEAQNPERKISEAIAGAQTVTEDKMTPAPDGAPKPKGKRGRKAKDETPADDESEPEAEEPAAGKGGGKAESGGKKSPF